MVTKIDAKGMAGTFANDDRRTRLNLAANQCRSCPRRVRVRITCIDGTVWASEGDTPQDVLLARGQSWTSTGRGTVVLQGMPTAVVEIARVPRRSRRWPWHSLAAMFAVRRAPIPHWE